MNERFKELAEQTGIATELLNESQTIMIKKFAELIVLECAELVETQHTWITSVAASALIRKHFGVEE